MHLYGIGRSEFLNFLFVAQVSTWLELHDRLMANGRLMVNCGGIDEGSSVVDGSTGLDNLSNDEAWLLNSALKALSKAFPGQVSFCCWYFIILCIKLLYIILPPE